MTLDDFLNSVTDLTEYRNNTYIFTYKQVRCLGSYTDFGFPICDMTIKPLSAYDDIGGGKGMSISVKLEKPKKHSELILTLEEMIAKMKKEAGRSSFGDSYFIMWNEKECLGELLERLIKEEKEK